MKTIQELICCVEKLDDRLTAADAVLTASVAAADAAEGWGNATLVAGTIAVADTSVTADSVIVVGRKTIGGTVGNMSYTLSAGVGFTVNSSSNTDTSTVSYHVRY